MDLTLRSAALAMILMLGAAGLSTALKPVRVPVPEAARPNYEQVIPKQFGTWKQVDDSAITMVNAEQKEVLDSIYSQIVSRRYLDSQTGKVVMLAVAYGEEQTKRSQVHLPEICYPAQGFMIMGKKRQAFTIPNATIPVLALDTVSGLRHEQVSYWIRVGEKIATGALEQKIATIKEGFAGRVADGMLFRVSSIDPDSQEAHQLQQRFVADLLLNVSPADRRLLIGNQLQ